MKSKNLIVFDMDGVIIDVSNSYRDTVRHTIKLFFRPAPNAARMPEPLFDLSDLAGLKQSGGLNNDWDLSYQAICLLFTLVEKPNFYDTRDPWSTYRRTLSGCDLSKLADYLNSTDGPLMTLLNQHGKIADPLISRFDRGDFVIGNSIKQIFSSFFYFVICRDFRAKKLYFIIGFL